MNGEHHQDNIRTIKNEQEGYIETTLAISDGDTYIELATYECKPGYHFKRKGVQGDGQNEG